MKWNLIWYPILDGYFSRTLSWARSLVFTMLFVWECSIANFGFFHERMYFNLEDVNLILTACEYLRKLNRDDVFLSLGRPRRPGETLMEGFMPRTGEHAWP